MRLQCNMAGYRRTEMSARDTPPKIVRISRALVTQNVQYICIYNIHGRTTYSRRR